MSTITAALPPGPRGYPLVGILPDLLRDPVAFCAAAGASGDGVVRLKVGPATAFLVTHPDYIKHILVENNRNYWKGAITRRARFLLGAGLVTSDGELWRSQRRLMQPAFHRQRIEGLGQLIAGVVGEQVARWERGGAWPRELDISAEMGHLTLEIIIRAMFSTGLSPAEARELGEAFKLAFQHVNTRLFTFFLPDSWRLPGQRRAEAALAVIDRAVYQVIEQRRRAGDLGDDLLALLLAARAEGGGAGMSDGQLHDEIVTMFGAGHETTAAALTWTLQLLGEHPEVEDRLHAELDTVLAGRAPGVADMPALPYTRMVLEESMRIRPPVWIYFRTPYEADTLGPYQIPAGAPVFLSPYATHHDPRFWDDPERFDPGRFSPERSAERHRYAYFPFSSGQRACIGSHMAMIEATIALATLAQRYRFRLRPGFSVRPQTASTLQPRGGLPMRVERRDPVQ